MLYNETADEKPSGKETDNDIVLEANDRWHATNDWQGTSDERQRSDIKFSNGDSVNAWQWPDRIYQERTGDETDLPALTINKTRVHNDIIINEMSKHEMGIKVRPTAGKASAKAAGVIQSLIRRIQNISKYSTQRRRVAEHQVDGGIGYIVIETRYTSNRSRNQDIYLTSPRDPTGVFLDPWIKEPDGSDANFGFTFERIPRKEFNRKYPKWKNKVGTAPLNTQFAAWLSEKEVVVAKYYRKVQKPDTYVWYKLDNGEEIEKLASEIKEETRGDESKLTIFKALMDDIKEGRIEGGTREVSNDEVEWFLIAGDQIIDRGKWAGKYIPICRAVGREIVIDNTLDRKGHTRPLIDAQRMLNYAASCSVEGVASQVKAKFLVALRAMEGVEDRWKDANLKNYIVLPWNDLDDEASPDSQKVPPPIPVEPPKPSPGWLQVGVDAERHMMMISGQYQAQLGENDGQSAISGKAIGQRQEQGDTATYHFIEHMSDMDRFIGVQLLDLIPKIYDTKRTLQVEDQKGELSWIMIDPDQKEALRELQGVKQQEDAVKLALNPSLGEYECVSDPGPTWATKREEAWDAIAAILQSSKELVAVVGDLLFKFGDFEGADELMERLQKEIKANKPYLFDEGPDPAMQAAQQQIAQLTAEATDLMTKLAEEKLRVRGRDERRDIEAFKAETQRIGEWIKLLASIVTTPAQRAQFEHELSLATHDHVFSMIQQANEPIVEGEGATAE
jgi:hypothetical protein